MSHEETPLALKESIAKDEEQLRQLSSSERDLLQNIPLKGFAAATTRADLVSRMRFLELEISENKIKLASMEHF